MWQRILSVTAVLISLLMPAVAFAADDPETIDPRTEGYSQPNVVLKGGGPALTWMLLIFLALICVAVLFKNARRTHLD